MSDIHPSELGQQMQQLAQAMIKTHISPAEAIEQLRRSYLATLLEQENGNICAAAKRAGIHRNSFSRNLPQQEIDRVKRICRNSRRVQQLSFRGLEKPAGNVSVRRQVA